MNPFVEHAANLDQKPDPERISNIRTILDDTLCRKDLVTLNGIKFSTELHHLCTTPAKYLLLIKTALPNETYLGEAVHRHAHIRYQVSHDGALDKAGATLFVKSPTGCIVAHEDLKVGSDFCNRLLNAWSARDTNPIVEPGLRGLTGLTVVSTGVATLKFTLPNPVLIPSLRTRQVERTEGMELTVPVEPIDIIELEDKKNLANEPTFEKFVLAPVFYGSNQLSMKCWLERKAVSFVVQAVRDGWSHSIQPFEASYVGDTTVIPRLAAHAARKGFLPAARAASDSMLHLFRARYGIPTIGRCDSQEKLCELLADAVTMAEEQLPAPNQSS